MPAVAVTDHGNLFAAANFYHQATTHGVKPIIGCEVYVAPDNHKNRGAEAERSNHLVLLCENERRLPQPDQARFHRIPRRLLLQAAHRSGASGAAQQGTDRAFRLPARRSGRCARCTRNTSRRARTRTGCATFSAKAISSSKCRIRASRWRQRINRDLVQLSRETGIPLVATNDCHYLTQSDAHAQEVLMCIQTGKTMSDTPADEVRHRSVLFQDGRRNGAGVPRIARRALAHRGDRRALQRENPASEQSVPGIQGSGRPHDRFVFRKSGARRICQSRAAARAAARRKVGCAIRSPNTRAPVRRNRDDQEDALRRLFPDRLGFHPLRARAGHSRRSGPRLGGGQPGELRAAHHRRRSAAVRPAVRALPQSRAHFACPISISISACGGAAK